MPQARCALLFAGWNGNGRHPKWDEISNALHALGVAAQTVEMVGRSSADSIHGEKLWEVFDHLARDIEDEIDTLKELLNLEAPVRKGVEP